MPTGNIHDAGLINAQLRAASLNRGEPYASLPLQSLVGAIAKHGGMYTLLDSDMMTARIGALAGANAKDKQATSMIVEKLQSAAASFFYKLVDGVPGYVIHSELMAHLSEPGKHNGVTYDEGVEPSPDVPAAFTFVGQFIDHDLTFNGMNLTVNEQGTVSQDEASPIIDLDSVYGPRPNVSSSERFNEKVFDVSGRFILHSVKDRHGIVGWDVPRHSSSEDSNSGLAYIFDPRNDENQLILQIHILIQRFHNKLIDSGFPQQKLGNRFDPKDKNQIIECVRREVVANWQSFILNEYMPAVIRHDVLAEVLQQIKIKPKSADEPQREYGNLKHKPYRDLVTGKNVVRMPHEFAIGFRFGHSQLRPMYLLNNNTGDETFVLLFRDARLSEKVKVELPDGKEVWIDGKDDLRGHRPLKPEHVIDWTVFYPLHSDDPQKAVKTHSLLIDHKITARVFNLPETAIPDDIKYIGNLPHRNLIRSSQIGIVSGEELADFYGIDRVPPEKIMESENSRALFELDSNTNEFGGKAFKTPLWYYLLKEAEVSEAKGAKLGKLGSRLVAEVLAGAVYYGNDFRFDDNWSSFLPNAGQAGVTLHNIIDFVNEDVVVHANKREIFVLTSTNDANNDVVVFKLDTEGKPTLSMVTRSSTGGTGGATVDEVGGSVQFLGDFGAAANYGSNSITKLTRNGNSIKVSRNIKLESCTKPVSIALTKTHLFVVGANCAESYAWPSGSVDGKVTLPDASAGQIAVGESWAAVTLRSGSVLQLPLTDYGALKGTSLGLALPSGAGDTPLGAAFWGDILGFNPAHSAESFALVNKMQSVFPVLGPQPPFPSNAPCWLAKGPGSVWYSGNTPAQGISIFFSDHEGGVFYKSVSLPGKPTDITLSLDLKWLAVIYMAGDNSGGRVALFAVDVYGDLSLVATSEPIGVAAFNGVAISQ
jgi:hypothetical protein